MFTRAQIERIEKAMEKTVADAIVDEIEDGDLIFDAVRELLHNNENFDVIIKTKVRAAISEKQGKLEQIIEDILDDELDPHNIQLKVRKKIKESIF